MGLYRAISHQRLWDIQWYRRFLARPRIRTGSTGTNGLVLAELHPHGIPPG